MLRFRLLCLALILAGCTAAPAAVTPTLRGPIVPTRVIPPSNTPTATDTPSNTPTNTPTNTDTPSATSTFTPTASFTPSDTPTFTLTPSETATNTPTYTLTPSDTPTFTLTPSFTPTEFPTATDTALSSPTLPPSPPPSPTLGESLPYRFATSFEPMTLAGAVTLDQPITGSIDNQHPALLYSFDASAGNIIDVSLSAQSSSLDTFLMVLDPKGREVARDDDLDDSHHDSAIRGLALEDSGTYVIVATRYAQDFGSTTGAFELSITRTPSGEAAFGVVSQQINYGASINGKLDDTTIRQTFTFRAAAGDVITVEMLQASGDLDPKLTLTNNLGTILAQNDDDMQKGTLDAAIRGYILPRSGYYTLVADHFTGSSNSGNYLLRLTRDSQNATGVDALIDPINSASINDAGTLYTNFSAGDEINSDGEEHAFQSLVTFRLPPNDNQPVQSATFQLQPCYERGGSFGALGALTIYEDNFGLLTQSRTMTHPLPGARVLSTQSNCDPLDITDEVQAAYANGREDLQLRLVFRDRSDNGASDEVMFTPNLVIEFGG